MKKVSILLIAMLVLFAALPSPLLAAGQTNQTPDPKANDTVENDGEEVDKPSEDGVEPSVDEETDSTQATDVEDSSKEEQETSSDANADDKTTDSSEEDKSGSDHTDGVKEEAQEEDQAESEQDSNDVQSSEEEEVSHKAPSLQTKSTDPVKEKTSKLGHLRGSASDIYEMLGDESSAMDAEKYKDAVYYIKEQAELNGDRYYKISHKPSSTKGVVGWIKASDMSTHSHVGKDKKDKTLYIKGSGKAFTKAWGGPKDQVYDLSNYENRVFEINLTEKVGNNVWYRGSLDGNTVWAHESFVQTDNPVGTSKTSKLGHLRTSASDIYKTLGDESSTLNAEEYKHAVYYIKEQGELNGDRYYKISHKPSSTNGVVGWVKASDMSTHSHVGKDKKDKTLYIKGSGKAFTKAWGGPKDQVYDLSNYERRAFKVHLTEKVGKNVWYRGTLDGNTVWAHESFVQTHKPINTSKTSKLGHLLSKASNIYETPGDETSVKNAEKYKDAVYYIKEQGELNGDRYYKISHKPSSTKGVVGWVKASDMSVHAHKGVDKYSKQFFLTGEGKGYSKAWGGSKDLVYDLSNHRNESFKVNLTEKVGNNIWYRGELDGKTVWAHNSYVMPIKPSKTSKLGHISNNDVKIYASLTDLKTYKQAGEKYTNAVYYIKSKSTVGGDTFYLISEKPSAQKGVVGWVKANDLSTHTHKGTSLKKEDVFFTGKGKTFTKAWGGSKNVVYGDMSKYKNERLEVDLIEKVGNNVWYRGTFDDKTVWTHESNIVKSNVTDKKNLIGHLNSHAKQIYKTLGDASTIIKADPYKNAVYDIKKQAVLGDTTYNLISTPSDGNIGWIKHDHMSTNQYSKVDENNKNFFFNGEGEAYSKPWGGKKDLVYGDLSSDEDEPFDVDITAKVGNYTWYHGTYKGKKIWINESNVVGKNITNHTQYGLTLKEALDMQKAAGPKTDKYSGEPAYIHDSLVDFTQTSHVNNNGVRLRTSTSLANESNIEVTVNKGTPVEINDTVEGDSYKGSKKWYKVTYKDKSLYVHASLVDQNDGEVAITNDEANVRSEKDTSSHIYGTVSKGTVLTVIGKGEKWHKIQYNHWRNPKNEEIEDYLDPNNFVNDTMNKYQFLDLEYFTGVPAAELKSLLPEDKDNVLHNTESIFRKAAEKAGINELYLVSHALLETGHGSSNLAQGIDYNGKTVYNFFGIGAYDNCAENCGAKTAYDEGWFTVEDAIMGGAEFAGDNYINVGQNTLYNMRWNPEHMDSKGYASHQYATDIGWAGKQVGYYNDFYADGHYNLRFDVPSYNK